MHKFLLLPFWYFQPTSSFICCSTPFLSLRCRVTHTTSLHCRSSSLLARLDGSDISSSNNTMVSLERLESQLLQRLHTLLTHLLYLASKDSFGCSSRIDTVCLDGHDDSTADFEEEMSVQADNTSLIRLSTDSRLETSLSL